MEKNTNPLSRHSRFLCTQDRSFWIIYCRHSGVKLVMEHMWCGKVFRTLKNRQTRWKRSLSLAFLFRMVCSFLLLRRISYILCRKRTRQRRAKGEKTAACKRKSKSYLARIVWNGISFAYFTSVCLSSRDDVLVMAFLLLLCRAVY